MSDVCREIWRRGGTALSAELGVDRRSLRRALDSGDVVRLSRGVYALSSHQPPVLAAARVRGTASHASAAQLWMLELVKAPVLPHVTVRRNRSALPGGLVVHWCDLPHPCPPEVLQIFRTVLYCVFENDRKST